ncbi:MAG: hypothetical protein J6D45_07615 [Clostridia bacterium]|nr:hypothetical protein [Clostridia bacterium]
MQTTIKEKKHKLTHLDDRSNAYIERKREASMQKKLTNISIENINRNIQ